MGFSEQDHRHMRRALELAEQGRGYVEPNPLVGAVLVRDGREVAAGYYRRFGGPHAEVNALEQAGGRAEGATLYVTLEPCDHEGKTPACVPRVGQAGLRRVVIAVTDPTSRHGGGARLLRECGLTVETGLCRQEAVRQNAGFFKMAACGRPLVTAKWAMSLDGKIATAGGSSRWISSEPARHLVHRARGRMDCIIVGARTAAADDPLLTCRDAEKRRTAARLVMCGRTVPDAASRLVQTVGEAPVLLAFAEGRPPEGLRELVGLGCEALPVPAGAGPQDDPLVDPPGLLESLGSRRMTNVLIEGGQAVLGAFFDAGEVDRVMAFVAPLVLGGEGAPTPVSGRGVPTMEEALRLDRAQLTQVGPDALLEGWTSDPVQWAP